MTDRIKDGGPAFPSLRELGDVVTSDGGMTLRDWFAGQALAAMLTNEIAANADKDAVSQQCYHYADFMLEARK